MQLTIVAPSGILCHTSVEKVTFPGSLGTFTVLPGHAPLIAQLTAGKIRYATGTEEYEREIKRGFVRIERDTVVANVELSEPCSQK
ncbi:ATP synthase F1 subunit epsilon [Bacteroides sp. f07]|uniref:F0F1 ATP synthase subunit epsilon n=1 Tax=Bacteroides sp. f07 TaxID=3132704 RepID=UPI0034B1333E